MAGPSIEKMALKDLLELEIRVKKAIANARERERADVKNKLVALAEDAGFSLNDLFGGRGRGKSGGVAKFANPDNRAQTWTGRGRKPNWLVAKLNKGAKMDDFAI